MNTISIIGLGRVGGALAIALDRAGLNLDNLVFRISPPLTEIARLPAKTISYDDVESIDSDVVLVATEDQQLKPVAERLSLLADAPRVVLHLSGSLSSDALESLRSRGAAVGSVHPLVSISDPVLGASRFAGAYFCIEGDVEAVSAAETLVRSLKGKWFTIESRLKPLYHAAAVMASGHVTALIDASIETLSKCGLAPEEAKGILLPLVESVIANLQERMPPDALTGPFVRGDIEAFYRHLDAFEGNVDENILRVYLELAQRSIRIAGIKTSGSADRNRLAEAISIAKRNIEC